MQQRSARLTDKRRKRETRLKIQLGGLVFTADLNNQLPDLEDEEGEARAIILGILGDAFDKLNDQEYRSKMLRHGRQIFTFKARVRLRSQN